MTGQNGGDRGWLPFRAVNRRGQLGFDPGMQRHHLLPRQLLRQDWMAGLLRAVGRDRLRFDDFRRNGLLLPATDRSALRIGLPLHRGPHRTYNELVSERVGQIEASWAQSRARTPEAALTDALARLELLQRALRRRLLDQRRRLLLSRKDPLGAGADFTELDALADELWPATEVSGP
ncbi:MAG: hypothetical protein RL339_2751 [Pseudomonadota bacterium]|jgi:hypothetical protein